MQKIRIYPCKHALMTGRVFDIIPLRGNYVRNSASLLMFFFLVAAGVFGQGLRLNESGYFETPGVNIFVFSNEYNGFFFDEKTAGIEIIHHGVRTATGGAVFTTVSSIAAVKHPGIDEHIGVRKVAGISGLYEDLGKRARHGLILPGIRYGPISIGEFQVPAVVDYK